MGPGMVGALLIVLAVAWSGCGAPGNDGAAREPLSAKEASSLDQSVAGNAECESGEVYLGASAGWISFRASCASARSGGQRTLSVAVGRLGTKPGSLVRRYKPRVRIVGEGFRGSGPCSLDRDAIVCRAQYPGRVSLSGEFRVMARDRCEINVTMTAPEPPRCRSQRCLTDLRSQVLFDSRPSGC